MNESKCHTVNSFEKHDALRRHCEETQELEHKPINGEQNPSWALSAQASLAGI